MCNRAIHRHYSSVAALWRDTSWTSRGTALHIPISGASTSAQPAKSAAREGAAPSRKLAKREPIPPSSLDPRRKSSASYSAFSVEAAGAATSSPSNNVVLRRLKPETATPPPPSQPISQRSGASSGLTQYDLHPEAPCSSQIQAGEDDLDLGRPSAGSQLTQIAQHSSKQQLGALITSSRSAQGFRSGAVAGKEGERVGERVGAGAKGPVSRRHVLASLSGALAGLMAPPGAAVAAQRTPAQCRQTYSRFLVRPDYSGPGPLAVSRLPRREHTCISCFPACVNATCTLKVEVVYPKGGPDLGLGPPFPLAVFSAGFLIGSESYRSYAERLASWGYTVLMYDRNETVASLLDDAACVRLLVELMDWAATDPLMRRLADLRAGVYMVGHSRGGKLAALAGAEDARVTALCLIDPVDNTVYAPLAPGFPSALAALRNMPQERPLPLAVVGGGLGGDCAPRQTNYRAFFTASTAPSWEVAIPEAGHFQFLDALSGLQRALCPSGDVSDEAVRAVGLAVMVAWGESIIRHRGADIFRLPVPYPGACQQQTQQQPQDPAMSFPAAPVPSPRSTPPLPSPLSRSPRQQWPQLAQLQQRQGLRGQASLAQAAYAAATVLQQEPLLGEESRSVADSAAWEEGGAERQAVDQIRNQGLDADGRESSVDTLGRAVACLGDTKEIRNGGVGDDDGGGGGGGVWRGKVRQCENPQVTVAAAPRPSPSQRQTEGSVLSLPPAEAAASSRVPPGGRGRQETPSGTAGGGITLGRKPGLLMTRDIVVQEALRPGLDRLVTRLQYDTGLQLETRYKNFDNDDEDVRRLLYGDLDER